MSVYNAAYPYSLGPGNSAPYRTSDYSSQHEPDPSPSDALVPGSRRSVGQDPHRYHTQGSARTPTRHPGNTAGYSDQYPVGNVGDYDPTRDHYHPIAPSLDSRVSESPMYHAEPYDRFSFGRAQYGQPPGVIAPYGVTGQPLGDYANQGKSLYEGQQSDDDFQRHNADRNRREGRAQDRFGQRNQRASKEKEYFLNGEGIHVDVLQRDICKYLGSEASVRPAMLNGMHGFVVTAWRPFTQEMIHDLQDESRVYSRDVRDLSPEYRRDARSLCNSLSPAAEARAMDLGESRIYT